MMLTTRMSCYEVAYAEDVRNDGTKWWNEENQSHDGEDSESDDEDVDYNRNDDDAIICFMIMVLIVNDVNSEQCSC